MSEMLGNQFFMARNYPAAQKEFEEVLLKDPQNRSAKKKLVVCYSQTGRVKDSIKLFSEIISDDIEFIINTDPVLDDCPCPELIEKIEKYNHHNESDKDKLLILAIIWLYCDVNKSLEYFKKLTEQETNNPLITSSIQKIESYLETHHI